MTLKDYLAEQMKDPEFRDAYEQISAEADEKLAEAMKQEPLDFQGW